MLDASAVLPFGKRLQELLEARGPEASQAWLADKSGIDRSLVSRMIRAEREPTLETLHCLAPVLGVDVAELVRGTTAEGRLRDGEGLVRRADFEDAVGRLIEYERRNRELEARVRSLTETTDRERESRRTAERKAEDATRESERANADFAELEQRYAAQTADIRRHEQALARAVGEFLALKKQLDDLKHELGDTKTSSRIASLMAAIAAGAGVATVAHFLADDESDEPTKKKAKKEKRR